MIYAILQLKIESRALLNKKKMLNLRTRTMNMKRHKASF